MPDEPPAADAATASYRAELDKYISAVTAFDAAIASYRAATQQELSQVRDSCAQLYQLTENPPADPSELGDAALAPPDYLHADLLAERVAAQRAVDVALARVGAARANATAAQREAHARKNWDTNETASELGDDDARLSELRDRQQRLQTQLELNIVGAIEQERRDYSDRYPQFREMRNRDPLAAERNLTRLRATRLAALNVELATHDFPHPELISPLLERAVELHRQRPEFPRFYHRSSHRAEILSTLHTHHHDITDVLGEWAQLEAARASGMRERLRILDEIETLIADARPTEPSLRLHQQYVTLTMAATAEFDLSPEADPPQLRETPLVIRDLRVRSQKIDLITARTKHRGSIT